MTKKNFNRQIWQKKINRRKTDVVERIQHIWLVPIYPTTSAWSHDINN